MLSTEGVRQGRYKRQCFPPFREGELRGEISAFVETSAYHLIDEFVGRGSAELCGEFCSPLAAVSVGRILGLRGIDTEQLRSVYDDFAAALANFDRSEEVRRRGLDTVAGFRGVLQNQLADAEDGTLLAVLAHASVDRLSDSEIISNALLILFGGLETTESMILNALWALLNHEEQHAEVLADRRLLPNAVEEALRWETPVQTCTRHATRTIALGAAEIEAGETVQCMLGAANRDAEHFERPEVFDIHRRNASDHLSFGFGAHFCLGAALARREAEIGINALLDRLPDLRIERDRSASPRGHEFRKPAALWVSFSRL